MIFAIICEELGLFGAVSIILIFLFMIYRFMIIANNAPDLFGALLVVGVMGHIAIQVILNIAVVTNTCLLYTSTGSRWRGTRYGGISASAIPMNRVRLPRYLPWPPAWRKGCLREMKALSVPVTSMWETMISSVRPGAGAAMDG